MHLIFLYIFNGYHEFENQIHPHH